MHLISGEEGGRKEIFAEPAGAQSSAVARKGWERWEGEGALVWRWSESRRSHRAGEEAEVAAGGVGFPMARVLESGGLILAPLSAIGKV